MAQQITTHKRTLLICSLSALLCLSCQHMPTFIAYQDIDSKQWDSRDTVTLNIPALTNNIRQQIRVGARITKSYNYNTLSLLVTQRDSNGTTIHKDTVHLSIADKKGNMLKSGFPFVETTSLTTKPMTFKAGMPYTLEVTHIMKQMQLNGINAVGVEISTQPTDDSPSHYAQHPFSTE